MTRAHVRRRLLVSVGLALVLGGAFAAYRHAVRAEVAPAARGRQLAHSSGCFACHGSSGDEHRANFRRTSPETWRARDIPSFWENGIDEADVLITWITEGCPPEERERHERLFLQMPAYGQGWLDADEIDAIAAWILADGLHRVRADGGSDVTDAETIAADAPQRWRHADTLARRHGCYQCHGELGQGGVPNPASFKGYIPGFFGHDFLELTDGGEREEIRHWIEHGRGRAIESGPVGRLARYFFSRQAIGMPAYAEQLSPDEISLLVDFLLELNRRGPLAARDVETVAKELLGPES